VTVVERVETPAGRTVEYVAREEHK
jgi:hypothetical protein